MKTMMKALMAATALVGAGASGQANALTAVPATDQTTIGPGGMGNESYQLSNNGWVGQSFTSPGGALLSFSFTDTRAGSGSTLFRLAAFNDGLISAPFFQRSIVIGNGSTTLANIDTLTIAGQHYVAYLTNGDNVTGPNYISGYIYQYYPYDYYVGGSSFGFQESSPSSSRRYNEYTNQDLAFTATFGDVAAVPEPATWLTMLLGFGMMGATMRYRRRSTKVAIA